ncbi:MAG TPA: hypothetical protein VNN09_00610 [Candidatus Competibacteraceae bacterium]|nr:hypothetical protein [Candidatus Competibacteraceae bacterium]
MVRILVGDPGQPEQVQAARELAHAANRVFVAQVVLVARTFPIA